MLPRVFKPWLGSGSTDSRTQDDGGQALTLRPCHRHGAGNFCFDSDLSDILCVLYRDQLNSVQQIWGI